MRVLLVVGAAVLLLPVAFAGHPQSPQPPFGGRTVPDAPPLLTIEVETFDTLTDGELVADAVASGGKAWRLPTYGTVATTVSVPSTGIVWIEVRARGTHPEGMPNPHLHVEVDGEQRAEAQIGEEWRTFRQPVPMLAGDRRIELQNFDNTRSSKAPAREMIFDTLVIGTPTLESAPVVGTSPVVVDGRDIHAAETGVAREDDTARDGHVWYLWGAGCFLEAWVAERAGAHEVNARLLGRAPKDVGTHVTIVHDGEVVNDYFVGEAWVERETLFDAGAGPHVLEICYDNDRGGDEKRTLTLDEFSLRRISDAPEDEAPTGATPAAGAPPWPSAHGSLSNHRSAPSDIDRASAPLLERLWRFETKRAVTGTPAFADGVAYFGDWSDGVHAVRVADGTAVWSVEHGAGVDSSLALDERRVYVADMDGRLTARDRASGEVVWQVEAGVVAGTHLYGSPVVHDGRVYQGVASEQTLTSYEGPQDFRGSVACFDARTGDLLWRTWTQPEGAYGVSVWTTPALDPDLGLLFVGTGNAYGPPAGNLSDAVLALRMEDGGIAWSFQATPGDTFNARGSPGPDRDFGASLVLFDVDGSAVVGAADKAGWFFVFDRATGEPRWAHRVDYRTEGAPPAQNEGFLGTPAYADGRIFAPTTDRSRVHALDAATGEVLWVHEVNPKPQGYGQRMFGSATATNDVVLQGSAFGYVHVLDQRTGELVANLSTAGDVQGGVALAGNVLLVPTAGGNLWAPGGGVEAWVVPARATGAVGGDDGPTRDGGPDDGGTPAPEDDAPPLEAGADVGGADRDIPSAGAWLTAAGVALAGALLRRRGPPPRAR